MQSESEIMRVNRNGLNGQVTCDHQGKEVVENHIWKNFFGYNRMRIYSRIICKYIESLLTKILLLQTTELNHRNGSIAV